MWSLPLRGLQSRLNITWRWDILVGILSREGQGYGRHELSLLVWKTDLSNQGWNTSTGERAQLLLISSEGFRLPSTYPISISSIDIYILKNLWKPRWFSLLLLRHALPVWAVRGFPDYSFSRVYITITCHKNDSNMKMKCCYIWGGGGGAGTGHGRTTTCFWTESCKLS